MYGFHIPPGVQLAPECPVRQTVPAHQSVPGCQRVLGFPVNLELDFKDRKIPGTRGVGFTPILQIISGQSPLWNNVRQPDSLSHRRIMTLKPFEHLPNHMPEPILRRSKRGASSQVMRGEQA